VETIRAWAIASAIKRRALLAFATLTLRVDLIRSSVGSFERSKAMAANSGDVGRATARRKGEAFAKGRRHRRSNTPASPPSRRSEALNGTASVSL